jgi:hypothetical protein
VDQRLSGTRLFTLAAIVAAASALPRDAAAQVRSNFATVSLVATVPAGASFVPAPAGELAAVGGRAARPTFNLVVNASYRLEMRTALSRGSVVLPSDGRPGLLQLDGVRRSVEAVGIDADESPVTVDIVVTPAL